MRDAGELDPGDVPGRALLAREVPDRLVRVGEVVGEKASAVGLGEDSRVAPSLAGGVADLLGYRTQVEDVDDEKVPWFGTFDVDRAGQHVCTGKVDVAHVIG